MIFSKSFLYLISDNLTGNFPNFSRKIKNKMEKHFYKDLYRGVDEVFDNNYSYRQFYTTPNTTIPNDQEGFAKWLYFNEDKTLKESHL